MKTIPFRNRLVQTPVWLVSLESRIARLPASGEAADQNAEAEREPVQIQHPAADEPIDQADDDRRRSRRRSTVSPL